MALAMSAGGTCRLDAVLAGKMIDNSGRCLKMGGDACLQPFLPAQFADRLNLRIGEMSLTPASQPLNALSPFDDLSHRLTRCVICESNRIQVSTCRITCRNLRPLLGEDAGHGR